MYELGNQRTSIMEEPPDWDRPGKGSITAFLGGDTSVCRRKQERGGEKEMKHELKAKYLHGARSPALSPGWPQLPKARVASVSHHSGPRSLFYLLRFTITIFTLHTHVCECSQGQEGTTAPETGDVGRRELLAVSAGNKNWSSVRAVLLTHLSAPCSLFYTLPPVISRA